MKITPYTAPQDNRRKFKGILLDFNELTIPVFPKVKKALRNFVRENKIQLYPEYFDLEKRIEKYAGVSQEQIMITNGSDQGIDLLFRAFTGNGKVIIPSPSFGIFYLFAQICGNKIVKPSYNIKTGFPLKETIQAIDKETKLVVICNPNNPTGTPISLAEIEQVLQMAQESNAKVFVDEAYFEFSQITAVPLIKKYDNLIITRTFSKAFGLASLRVGYVISQKRNLETLRNIRGPFDINMAGCYAALAALKETQALKRYVKEVMTKAKPMTEKFLREKGIKFWPSKGNFILINSKFKNKGILTRPREEGARLTIGTTKQMKKFINTFKP